MSSTSSRYWQQYQNGMDTWSLGRIERYTRESCLAPSTCPPKGEVEIDHAIETIGRVSDCASIVLEWLAAVAGGTTSQRHHHGVGKHNGFSFI